MVVTYEDVDSNGLRHAKYSQYHKGYPIEGSFLMVKSDLGIVRNVYGFILKGFDIETSPLINEDVAFGYAVNHVNAEKYIWQDTVTYVDEET